jgi:hypothetical protein
MGRPAFHVTLRATLLLTDDSCGARDRSFIIVSTQLNPKQTLASHTPRRVFTPNHPSGTAHHRRSHASDERPSAVPHNLLFLLTPTDVAHDSITFAAITSPWAILAHLDTTVVLGLLNLLVLTFFRWRALKLRKKELELRHSEEVTSLRQRLSLYEEVAPIVIRDVNAQFEGKRSAFKSLFSRGARGTPGTR